MKNVKYPFELCSHYEGCSVNSCPLDPVYPNRYTDSDDPEQKCLAWKSSRLKIAEQFPCILQYSGLTQKEYRNKQNWECLPEEEKQIRLQRIAEINAKRWGRLLDQSGINCSSDTIQE